MATERVLEIALAGGVALIGLGLLLLVRRWQDQARVERERRLGLEEDSGVLVRHGVPVGDDLTGRLDSGFDRMVAGTGLDVTPDTVLALMVLLGVTIGGGLYLWRDDVGLGTFGFLLGMLVPLAVVWMLRGRYAQQVQQQLPDTIYLLARTLRAGMSLPQAVELVAAEGARPIAAEFERVDRSIKLGLPVATAVQMMAERLGLLDVNALSSTISFHQTTGGNLPLLLDRLAAGARDRNQFRGHFFAATAQGRITAVALAAAAPLMVIGYLVFQPEHVQPFLQSTNGWLVLAGCGLLEVTGLIWVSQILKVDY